jgi:hypothetical protein
MCHEYGMMWWQSESTEKKKTEDPKRDLKGMFGVPEKDLPKAAPAEKAEEKEFVPAK